MTRTEYPLPNYDYGMKDLLRGEGITCRCGRQATAICTHCDQPCCQLCMDGALCRRCDS